MIISPGQKHPWITPDSTSLLGELSPDTDSTDKHDGGCGSRARSTSQGARAFPASPLAPASSSRKEGADKQEMHTGSSSTPSPASQLLRKSGCWRTPAKGGSKPLQNNSAIPPPKATPQGESSPDMDSADTHDGGRGSRAWSTYRGAWAFPASPLAPASSSRKEGADKQEMHTDYPSLRTASGKVTKVHYRPASLGNSYPYFSRLDTRLSCGNSTARTIQIPARE